LLTFTYAPAEQGKVQGINEFMVFTAAALGSLLAGVGVDKLGWVWLNLASLPPVILVAWWIVRLADVRARVRESRLIMGGSVLRCCLFTAARLQTALIIGRPFMGDL